MKIRGNFAYSSLSLYKISLERFCNIFVIKSKPLFTVSEGTSSIIPEEVGNKIAGQKNLQVNKSQIKKSMKVKLKSQQKSNIRKIIK